MKIDVDCLVGNAHRTAAQFKWSAVLAERYFIVLEALHGVAAVACATAFSESDFSDSIAPPESPAQQANGTQFIFFSGGEPCSADRARSNFSCQFRRRIRSIKSPLRIGIHGITHPSAATKASQSS